MNDNNRTRTAMIYGKPLDPVVAKYIEQCQKDTREDCVSVAVEIAMRLAAQGRTSEARLAFEVADAIRNRR